MKFWETFKSYEGITVSVHENKMILDDLKNQCALLENHLFGGSKLKGSPDTLRLTALKDAVIYLLAQLKSEVEQESFDLAFQEVQFAVYHNLKHALLEALYDKE